MSTKKKLLQAAAGSAGGAGGLNVEQVFSTYLYTGNGSEQFIDNGINLGQANDGYSAYFGGSGYYVGAEQTTLTDFTVEGWFYFSNLASNRTLFTLGYADLQLYYRSASSNLAIYDSSAKTYSWTPTGSTWYHIALVRSGSSVELFVDGVSKGTQTSSATISGDLVIGGYAGATDPMNGYISNIRVSDNVRYSSNFTAPTSALSTDANTTLLTLQDDTFIDNSGNGNVITPSGGAEMVSHAPFTAADPGEGGMVWIKQRTNAYGHYLYDTERGVQKGIASDSTAVEQTGRTGVTSFNSNGFSLGNFTYENGSGNDIASWTFRKAPKFFDVVTATSIGSTSRVLSHNLGCDVGFAVVKRLDSTSNWISRHRSLTAGHNINLNTTQASFAFSGIVSFDSTTITINEANFLGTGNYVVYLFAHNNGDGDFGSTADQDIIKCGSYTGNGSATGPSINLGFEPQWVLIRAIDDGGHWLLFDNMRGINQGTYSNVLRPNTSDNEATAANLWGIDILPNGFQINQTQSQYNTNGQNYIYIAIRRGPMAVPTDATDVFAIDEMDNSPTAPPTLYSGFPVDMAFYTNKSASSDRHISSRMIGDKLLQTNQTNAEIDYTYAEWDFMDGWFSYAGALSNYYSWMWKRAPSFFDVVAYTGNGTAGRTVSHNLGVAPEMIWVKARTGSGREWTVWHKDTGGNGWLRLNTTDSLITGIEFRFGNNSTYVAPTDTEFTVGSLATVNASSDPYIAYLFASLDGVSKVGSFSHTNGTATNVDCGFSSGARFVLLKRYSSTGSWIVFDAERGIVSGNDPYLALDTTNAEVTSNDVIDPYSSGFTVASGFLATGDWIFYAIA